MVAVIPGPIVQVWDATGTNPLGPLTAVASMTISDVLSDVGSLAVSAPMDTPGMDLLVADVDRQVQVSIPGRPDLWFVTDGTEPDYIADDPASEPVKLSLLSLAAVLGEARVYPPGGAGTLPAERTYTDATPGTIIRELFDEAQTRGALQGVTLSGSASLASVDAGGENWPETVTQTVKAGVTVLEIIAGLVDLGLVEWRMLGRTLEVYRAGGTLDRTLEQVVLRPRRDVVSASLQRSTRDIATSVLVEGGEGATTQRTQSLPGRRIRETYLSAQAPAESISQVGELYLAAHAAADAQMTHELTDGDETPQPWLDYRCGDRIPTAAYGNGITVQRVAQIALTYDPTATKVTLEMGSILRTAEEKFDRQLRKLLPGDTL